MQKKLFLLALLVITGLSLSACGNTFHGFGKDMQEWGETIQETF